MSFQVSRGGLVISGGSGGQPLVPMVTMLPAIIGAFQVGELLTTTNGAWTNSPTSFTYQWNGAGVPISGETSSNYRPVSADVGNTVTISVTATNGSGSSTPATSAATGAVIDIIPVISTPASILGTPQVGVPITATNAIWMHVPTSLVYQWQAGGVNSLGNGATTLIYTPAPADVGLPLTITVTPTNSGGTGTPSTSAPSAAVISIAIPVNTALPAISGAAQNGQVLTITNGIWTNTPTSFTYQWKSAGVNIPAATTATYTATQADVGGILTGSVAAINGGGSSVPATSLPSAVVIDIIPVIGTAPSIFGTTQVGIPITAINAIWIHTITGLTYQWKAAGVNGTGVGASTLTYIPAPGDSGKTLTITVTPTNSGGTGIPSTSAASAVVIAAGAGGILDFSQASNSALIVAIAA